MSLRTIRLLHRIAVDGVADTFGLRHHGSARSRHAAARDRALSRAARWQASAHDRARDRARAGPAVLHARREPRLLRGWQARIGQAVAGDRGQSGGTRNGERR